jgi:hypothetical protein
MKKYRKHSGVCTITGKYVESVWEIGFGWELGFPTQMFA